MAKVHKITVYLIDTDNQFEDARHADGALRTALERYDMFGDTFIKGTGDLGEWSDDHPLNQAVVEDADYDQYFSEGG